MLPIYIWENLHFGTYLIGGMAHLACFWLYSDAALARRKLRLWTGLTGWLLLAASFFLGALSIESPLFVTPLERFAFTAGIPVLRLLGYLVVSVTLLIEPIQARPDPAGLTGSLTKGSASPRPARLKTGSPQGPAAPLDGPVLIAWAIPFGARLSLLLPFGAWLACYAYGYRAFRNLERHLRPAFVAFGVLGIYEVALLGRMLRTTANPTLFRLVAPYGPLWLVEHGLLLAASAILIWWVGRYLIRRLRTQLIMIFVSMSVGTFLVTTIIFSTYLLRFTESLILERLSFEARTVESLLHQTQDVLLANAHTVAQYGAVQAALAPAPPEPSFRAVTLAPQEARTETELAEVARELLLRQHASTLVVANADGQVLARGENPELAGHSVADDPLFIRALAGENGTALAVHSGALAPFISARAAVPVRPASGGDETVIGVIIMSITLDNAYVDGLKDATGLDVAFYAGDTLSASTIAAPGATTRWIGTKDTNERVTREVREERRIVSSAVSLLTLPYLAAYVPLAGADDAIIGVLLVGTPQTTLVATTHRTLQLTFATSLGLMLFSLFPSLFFADRIKKQLRA